MSEEAHTIEEWDAIARRAKNARIAELEAEVKQLQETIAAWPSTEAAVIGQLREEVERLKASPLAKFAENLAEGQRPLTAEEAQILNEFVTKEIFG